MRSAGGLIGYVSCFCFFHMQRVLDRRIKAQAFTVRAEQRGWTARKLYQRRCLLQIIVTQAHRLMTSTLAKALQSEYVITQAAYSRSSSYMAKLIQALKHETAAKRRVHH